MQVEQTENGVKVFVAKRFTITDCIKQCDVICDGLRDNDKGLALLATVGLKEMLKTMKPKPSRLCRLLNVWTWKVKG